jgi:hypothetical protein
VIRRVTTPDRQVLSLFVGAVVAGALLFLPASIPMSEGAVLSPEASFAYAFATGATFAVGFGMIASAAFVGIFSLGLPVWLILQRLRRDSLGAALAAGALAPTVTLALLLLTEVIAPGGDAAKSIWLRVFGDVIAWVMFGGVGAVGTVVALSMWLFAYRRERGPIEAFD